MESNYIFFDESCHLEKDRCYAMCIGYTKVNKSFYKEYRDSIKEIKLKHKTPMEIKWSNVSGSRMDLYYELIDFFFENEIDFRGVLVKNKSKLDHNAYNHGSSDNFYYKIVYYALNNITNPPEQNYQALLDYKDTRGSEKLKKINEIFSNKFNGKSPFSFQHIHSHDNVFMQITDLIIGAITFKTNKLHLNENANKSKIKLVEYLEKKSGYSIDEGTEPWETKFNIFDLQPKSFFK